MRETAEARICDEETGPYGGNRIGRATPLEATADRESCALSPHLGLDNQTFGPIGVFAGIDEKEYNTGNRRRGADA